MKIEVSNGELLDKMVILAIKKSHITDPVKLANVNREYDELRESYLVFMVGLDTVTCCEVAGYIGELSLVNRKLWDIEDQLRIKECNQEFDLNFIELARLVYKTNDERARIKKQINDLTKSELTEEKHYA